MRLIACLIARDEQENLPRCLRSLAGAVDGICLADTGSSDSTLDIARSFGARVRSIPWRDDFSQARNESLEMADGDWALQIDCDEELDPRSIPALRTALHAEAPCLLVEVELRDGTDRPGKGSCRGCFACIHGSATGARSTNRSWRRSTKWALHRRSPPECG